MALAAAWLVLPRVCIAQAATVERVSVAPGGAQGNAPSTASSLSADGRFVAFASSASNLVPDDTNLVTDVFVVDRLLGTIERVSVSSEGLQASGSSATPAISADGRYVAFASTAANLVSDDTNGRFDVFVRDRVGGTTERVSIATDGSQGVSDSVSPAISADGRHVAFASASANLVGDDTNAAFDVFVRDRLAAATARVSVASGGTQGDGFSLAPRISGDGSVVVFHSFATNLVGDDTNRVADVFAHETASGVTSRMSVAGDGTQGNGTSSGSQVSRDGRFVAFDSDASTLVAGDTNGRTDVFVHDRASGTTERVSVATDGSQGNNASGFVDPPAISDDGRYVAFMTAASNLVPNDMNAFIDVVLRDRVAGVTIRLHQGAGGAEANGNTALWSNLSADGRVASFASTASNLVADDTNGVADVFLWIDTCGDGDLDAGESCDDGNRDDGDCCSAACGSEAAGSSCSDDDLCTRSDACDGAGVCVGSDPVLCESGEGQCGSPGACDPATGLCEGGVVPDGTPCDDGDTCTAGDLCVAGICESGDLDPAACLSTFSCDGAVGWKRPPWWVSPTTVQIDDLFESALFRLGGTTAVCNAGALPEGQSASRQVCVKLRRVHDAEGEDEPLVVVRNVLGDQVLEVGRARQLCLPAADSPAPTGLDDFKCYSADLAHEGHGGSSPLPALVEIEDERGRRTVALKRVELLCNPASVAEGGVLHEKAHLVCYRIHERGHGGGGFRARTFRIHGPFGEELVTTFRRDHLCLPSLLEMP